MYGLFDLAEDWGFDSPEELIEECGFDSVIPAICVLCGYTTEMEPDQANGWCEDCGKNSVQSALILAGLI